MPNPSNQGTEEHAKLIHANKQIAELEQQGLVSGHVEAAFWSMSERYLVVLEQLDSAFYEVCRKYDAVSFYNAHEAATSAMVKELRDVLAMHRGQPKINACQNPPKTSSAAPSRA